MTSLFATLTKAASGAIAAAILCFAGEAQAQSPIGYVVRSDNLYRISVIGGTYSRTLLSNQWGVPTSMAFRSPWLHIITGNALWRASGTDGSWIQLGTEDWSGTTGMEWNSSTGKLYIVQGSQLHRMNDADNNATYTVLGSSVWSSLKAMTSLGSWLYIINGSTLYRVSPNDGSRTALGSSVWSGNVRMTKQKFSPSAAGDLYVLQGDDLWKVNPTTGARTIYGTANVWAGFTSIFCNNSGTFTANMYVTQLIFLDDDDAGLYRVDNAGGFHSTHSANYSNVVVSAGAACTY
jgi:hypothetical protein